MRTFANHSGTSPGCEASPGISNDFVAAGGRTSLEWQELQVIASDSLGVPQIGQMISVMV